MPTLSAWTGAGPAAFAAVANIAVASSTTAQKKRMYKAFMIISDSPEMSPVFARP